MISNRLHKIRIRALERARNYVDACHLNDYTSLINRREGRFGKKEFRIIKKNPKINRCPEE